jgi:hypothetical protein
VCAKAFRLAPFSPSSLEEFKFAVSAAFDAASNYWQRALATAKKNSP